MSESVAPIASESLSKKLVIAIDGHSSCGKSTLAKDLAKHLNYTYIDSGAMYRAVALYFLNNKVELDVNSDFTSLLNDNVVIEFGHNEDQRYTILNGENVEAEIRSPRVADIVSEVARNSTIRQFLVRQQRALGEDKAVIMDGRDIGTVVFPNADLKFFVTADVEVRAKRRYMELSDKGVIITFGEIKANLQKRDHIDSTRIDSPLKKAEGAIVIDTSSHTRTSQVEEALEYILSSLK